MKKITLLLSILLTTAFYGQVVVQDFSNLKNTADVDVYGGFGAGLTADEALADDPDNASNKVRKVTTAAGGDVWKGVFFRPQTHYIDLTTTKTVSIKVYSNTTTLINGKIQAGQSGQGDVTSAASESHGGTGWETLTFTFASATGEWGEFVLYTNVNEAGGFVDPATEVLTAYFDDITAVQGSAIPVPSNLEVLQDFSNLTNTAGEDVYGGFGGGLVADETLVADPDNASNQVRKVTTEAGGDTWKGVFFRPQTHYIDLTTNKNVSIKVYSNTASNFLGKIQASKSGQGEQNSDAAIAHGGTGWETLTFSFANKTGEFGEFVIYTNVDTAGGFIDPAIEVLTAYFDDISAVKGSEIPGTSTSNTVSVDGAKTWKGYVNAFNTSDDSYAFGFEYGVADLKTTVEATKITLQPNFAIWTAENANASWFDNSTTPNKYIETSSFVEDNSLAGSDLTFSGSIDSHTIASGYTVVAFIKALDPNNGYATVVNESMTLSTGMTEFSVSATSAQLVSGFIIQYGFSVKGPLGNPANESTLGSVILTDGSSTGGTGSDSNYCETVVTHFGIAAETASAIKLTIENTGTKTMKVTVESNDSDPIDELVIPAVTGAPAFSAKDTSVDGKISITLTWENAPTSDIDINILWSKESFGGNWQLSQDPVSVKFDSSCSTASVSKTSLLSISMYPNPATNSLNITAPNTIKRAVIYNILGKQVMSLNINKNSESIDVSRLNSGIYLIKYTIDNAIGTAKFIKQ